VDAEAKRDISAGIKPPRRFMDLSTELRLMIWEAASAPPPCGHILHVTRPPKTRDDVVDMLPLFHDAGLWRACPESRRVVRKAYSKQAVYYATVNEFGESPLCLGNWDHPHHTQATVEAEAIYYRVAQLPVYLASAQEGLQLVIKRAETLLWDVKAAMICLDRVLQPLLLRYPPYEASKIAEAWLLFGREAHRVIPLWRLQRVYMDMCNGESTYGEADRDASNQTYGPNAIMNATERKFLTILCILVVESMLLLAI
jgi:hypothetical protein